METPPVIGPNFKQLSTSQFYIELPDEVIWQYKGAVYGWDRICKKSELSEVAFSGLYSDLEGLPDIPGEAPVQSVNGRTGDVIGLAEQSEVDTKQDIIDTGLITASKTVVGAINEILVRTDAYATKPSAKATNPGQNNVTISGLINKTLVVVHRGDSSKYTVDVAASDALGTVIFNPSTGNIQFESLLSTGEQVFAEYLGVPGGNVSADALLREMAVSNQTVQVIPSVNLIDTTKLNSVKYYSYSNNAIIANTSQPTFGVTDFIPITSGQTVAYSGLAIRNSGGYFDVNKQPLSGVNIGAPSPQSTGQIIITAPVNASIAYMALNYDNTKSTSDLQLNSGTTKMPYQAYTGDQFIIKDLPDIKNRVLSTIIHGANYANKADALDGFIYSNGTGNLVPDSAGGRSRYFPPFFVPAGQWTISGIRINTIGGIYSSEQASGATRIGKINEPTGTDVTQYTFTVPAAVQVNGIYGAWLGINLEFSPSTIKNAFDNTVMLAKGTNTTYEPYYGIGVPGNKVYGDIPAYTKLLDFNPVKASVDSIVALDYENYYAFNGTTSKSPLPVTYTIDAIGDYVEFTGRFEGSNNEGLGLFGVLGGGNRYGFYVAGEIGLRGNTGSDPYTRWVIPGGTSDFKTYTLEVVSGGWKLSVDGVTISTQTKLSPLNINTLGDAYPISGSNTKYFTGALQYLSIHNATQDLTVTDFTSLTGQVDIEYVFIKKPSPDTGGTYPRGFYSYDLSDNQFIFYAQYPENPELYFGTVIKRTTDATIRQDIWRIYEGFLYKYNGTTMVSQGLKLIRTDTESEYVYKQAGRIVNVRTSYNGGYHGNEMFTQVLLFKNGVSLDFPSADVALTECNDMKYRVYSDMFECAPAGSPTPITASPILQAKHVKNTHSETGKLTIENFLKFESSLSSNPIQLDEAFIALFCAGNANGDTFSTDTSSVITRLYNDARYFYNDPVNNGRLVMNYYNKTNGLGMRITGEALNVIQNGVDMTRSFQQNCTVEFWDRIKPGGVTNDGDGKTYFREPWTVYPNDIINLRFTVEFYTTLLPS